MWKKVKLFQLFLVIFFIVGIIQPSYSLGKILLEGKLFDYNFTYLRAAGAFLSGINIYSFGDINYPSTALFLFTPLSSLPVFWGQIVFTLISIGCVILSFFVSGRTLHWKFSFKWLFFLLPAIFLSFPMKWTLGMGQINNLILLLIVLSFYYYSRKKNLLSGIALGLAIAFKIVPVLLLFFYLSKKRILIILSSVITVLLSFFFAGFFFGYDLIYQYFMKVLPQILLQPNKEIYYNQAFSGFIARMGINNLLLSFLVQMFALIILLPTLFCLFKRRIKDAYGYCLIISTMLLVSPVSWQHHFVWLLFPFLVLTFSLKSGRSLFLKAGLILSYLLTAVNIKHSEILSGSVVGSVLLSHVFVGNLVVWLLFLYMSWYHIADD